MGLKVAILGRRLASLLQVPDPEQNRGTRLGICDFLEAAVFSSQVALPSDMGTALVGSCRCPRPMSLVKRHCNGSDRLPSVLGEHSLNRKPKLQICDSGVLHCQTESTWMELVEYEARSKV